jgi:hypothetical protein
MQQYGEKRTNYVILPLIAKIFQKLTLCDQPNPTLGWSHSVNFWKIFAISVLVAQR